MYDDLVKRLRICPDYNEGCVNCLHKHDLGCRTTTMHEAADAIEELQADKAALNGTVSNLIQQIEELSKPRWIPVTERLPEKMQYVLVRYQNNDMAVASWFGGDEDIRFWRAMIDEGWEANCDSEPTHWTPLPEPPKEE